jgi:hypothetical protein
MLKTFYKYNWLRIILLTTLLLPSLLLWEELFTRMLLPQNVDSRMNILKSDPVIGFTYKPNAKTYEKGREYNVLYKINSLGLRDREYGPKQPGTFRVLLVGDSFSVSHGIEIEKSLSRQLENSLQRLGDLDNTPKKIEVINAANGGYSPYNYWKSYQRWAPVFNPDAVIIGLSPDDYDCGNEDSKYSIENGEILAVYKDGKMLQTGENGMVRKIRKWLSWNSEFYILLRNFFYYNDIAGRINLWKNAKANERNIQFEQFLIPQPESMEASWKKAFSYLVKLKKEADEDRVPVVIVPIPLKFEIDQLEFQRIMANSNLALDEIDIDKPLKMIEAFGKKENMPVFDPRAAIKECNEETSCYFVYDGHWIAEGIRGATDAIAKKWRKEGIAPWGDPLSGVQNN